MVINVDKENPNKTTGADCSRIFIYINRKDVRNFIAY